MRAVALRLSLMGTTCLLALACAGCGLVFVPRVQVFPGEVRGIRVVDEQTGQDLPQATVIYEIWPYDNWFLDRARLMELDPSDSLRECGSEPYRRLDVNRDADGVFRVEPCRTIGWMQWFFPLPLPLGWNLYHDYEARVTIRAPGYCELVLTYTPNLGHPAGWANSSVYGSCDLTSDRILTFSTMLAD
ncbi:MAG: hypothetical protein ABIG44_17715 [Planctomycetota bacterium]